MPKRIALFAGSFDPLTVGHIDIITRALRLVDELVVGVAVNIKKRPLFTLQERIACIEQAFEHEPVRAVALDGLLVEEARAHGCQAIVRGLRNGADFDYEFAMTSMNQDLAPEIETIFLVTRPEHLYISSSLVKEVARFGGEIAPYVPDHVAALLMDKITHSPS